LNFEFFATTLSVGSAAAFLIAAAAQIAEGDAVAVTSTAAAFAIISTAVNTVNMLKFKSIEKVKTDINDHTDAKIDSRIDATDSKIDSRIDATDSKIDARIKDVNDSIEDILLEIRKNAQRTVKNPEVNFAERLVSDLVRRELLVAYEGGAEAFLNKMNESDEHRSEAMTLRVVVGGYDVPAYFGLQQKADDAQKIEFARYPWILSPRCKIAK
jgi:hypothetical protein